MVFQKSSQPRRERSHVNRLPRWHAHPLQRRSIRYRRYNQFAIVLKADEPSVEQMIDTGRKQKPIVSVQAFVVCGIPPRLAVTGPQVRGIVNARNAAESLNRHHPLLEETLASPSGDDRLSVGKRNTDVSIHFGLNVVFPQFQVRISHRLWVARWWEDVIQADGTLGRLRRSEVIGTVAEFPTRRLAMQVLSQRLGSINNGKARPRSVRAFGDFVKDDWTPVVLPTLKYATQKHYRYMLDVHLNPAFGQRQLRELTREELQSFLSRKLSDGLSWEPVHHFKCGLSKILGAAEEWGYIAENAAQKTKLPRRHHVTERVVVTPVQVRDIAAY
jgi:hypothetical protein